MTFDKTNKATDQLIFISQQLTDQTFDKYVNGNLTAEELKTINRLLSSWGKLSEEIIERIEK